jgi:tellurite resistance protein
MTRIADQIARDIRDGTFPRKPESTLREDRMVARPSGSNADEWHLFLLEYLDNRANFLDGLTYMAVQIAEAIEAPHPAPEGFVSVELLNIERSVADDLRATNEVLRAAIAVPRRDGNSNG